jgi:hypothetical protein
MKARDSLQQHACIAHFFVFLEEKSAIGTTGAVLPERWFDEHVQRKNIH